MEKIPAGSSGPQESGTASRPAGQDHLDVNWQMWMMLYAHAMYNSLCKLQLVGVVQPLLNAGT